MIARTTHALLTIFFTYNCTTVVCHRPTVIELLENIYNREQ